MDDNPDDRSMPLKDYGSFSVTPVGDEDIESHHTERWQHQAMYVGLHFPKSNKSGRHRHRRHRHHHKSRSTPDQSAPAPAKDSSVPTIPATPSSARVQFLLGQDDDSAPDKEIHDIFCEMEELRTQPDGNLEWKETARWIKFEENVEEGGERWSKPHVATLALHSLFELRRGLLSGCVMLDVDAHTLPHITELVLDNMIAAKQLEAVHREAVTEVLLRRHRHQHQKGGKTQGSSKGLPLIRSLADIGKKTSSKQLQPNASSSSLKNSSSNIEEELAMRKYNEHFAKKIPPGAEASNILVGEVDFLPSPIMAFVRLQKATMLGDLTEVPVPTRFLFILLGPDGHDQNYHEIGRSIATLMSDEVFHEIAYKARNREDLLAGMDEFLDQVTVLPPGEWDPTIRIEPPKSVPSQEARKHAAQGVVTAMPNGKVASEEEEEGHGDATLLRTGRLFGGLVQDIKRKAPWYWSDVKDAFHVQTIASFFFMYFACLTPIITFGGLLGSATDNNIAAMESLLSGAICGVSYHLFSGQPLTIIGSTGPVLVFETIVYNFCYDNGLNYLAMRFWIGIWMSLILLLIVMFDMSALVRYITRFTEESFAVLIALIFIIEAFKKLIAICDNYPVDFNPDEPKDYNCFCMPKNESDWNSTEPIEDPHHSDENHTVYMDWTSMDVHACEEYEGKMTGSGCDTPHYKADIFFFSCLLFFLTFVLSMGLKSFRNTRFLPNKARVLVSDFAVFTAIVISVGVDAWVGLDTPKLEVPDKFEPTRDDRGWIIDPFANPVWTIPGAILPSLLATILIFMDQQITAVIVNRKEHLLVKGGGYHLDLLLIAIQIAICSTVGTPWFVAATVLSINHVRSLTRESETSAPGEKPKFLGIREQRVTGTVVFIFVGASAMMASVLKIIPMPVLFGVFLFMGVSSVKGLQLVQRVSIIFMPPKYQPDYMFLRHVPLRRTHLFTAVQVLCLAVLWVIKTIHSISIVFPLMVLAMCFVRKGLDWVFTRHELKWLDDIMPEIHKREKEEKKKKKKDVDTTQVMDITAGSVQIPLMDGKSISIPVEHITFDPITKQLRFSDELSRNMLIQQLAANESNVEIAKNVNILAESPKETKKPVKFSIADDDQDTAPEIIVDPPSSNPKFSFA